MKPVADRAGSRRGEGGRLWMARWGGVILFAVAMAWMEAATVVYLRTLEHRLAPAQLVQEGISLKGLETTELVREAATLVMLGCVAWLAGARRRDRLGHFLVAFGVWDVFYYLFMRIITGWPPSLLSWDILFLLPLPWWGPVLAPTMIALLMIAGGTLLIRGEAIRKPVWPSFPAVAANILGVTLALYVFMADAIRDGLSGKDPINGVVPSHFPWPLFLSAWVLMGIPVYGLFRQSRWLGHSPASRHSSCENAASPAIPPEHVGPEKR